MDCTPESVPLLAFGLTAVFALLSSLFDRMTWRGPYTAFYRTAVQQAADIDDAPQAAHVDINELEKGASWAAALAQLLPVGLTLTVGLFTAWPGADETRFVVCAVALLGWFGLGVVLAQATGPHDSPPIPHVPLPMLVVAVFSVVAFAVVAFTSFGDPDETCATIAQSAAWWR